MVLEDLQRASSEEKVKPSESPKEVHVHKKRRVSSIAEGDNEVPVGASSSSISALSRTSASHVDSDDDDLIMDVKGKGKEIVRPRVPTPRKPISTTPRKLGTTPSKKRFAFSDDEDDHGKDDLYSPHSKRRNPGRFSPKPSTLGRSTRANPLGSSPLEGFETSFNLPGASSVSKRKPFQPAALDSDNDNEDQDLEISEVRPKKCSSSVLSSSPPPPAEDEAPVVDDKADNDDEDFSKWVTRAAQLEATQPDWPIALLVTSRMPHTKPLSVRRRMKQSLKVVLDTWIQYQENNGCKVPEQIQDKLFLTFKGNRIYSNSTIASLGVKVDANGILQLPPLGVLTGREGMDGYTQGRNPGLVLEVWHEEFYEDEMAKDRKRRERELGLLDDDDHDDDEEDQQPQSNGQPRGGSEAAAAEAAAAEVKKSKIRIVLKAKDLQPLKIAVYEDTPVGTMVQAFRNQKGIEPGKAVVIQFDGEELREDMLVGDMDIERDEPNQFEVYIK